MAMLSKRSGRLEQELNFQFTLLLLFLLSASVFPALRWVQAQAQQTLPPLSSPAAAPAQNKPRSLKLWYNRASEIHAKEEGPLCPPDPMKNLRQKNPEFKALQQKLKAPAERWLELDFEQQTELCLRFLTLPQIRLEGCLETRICHILASSVADLAPQVSRVLQEFPGQFRQLQHLLEQTVGLYLLEN